MAEEKKRLDESLSNRVLQKSLTGKTGTKPALERIQISPSGQVQPRTPASSPSTTQSTPNTVGSVKTDK
jgi:hypothetical protein